MADPATIVTAAGAALQGLSMVGGAIGGAQNAAGERADTEAAAQQARMQNNRLLQGGAEMPGYTQAPMGYGPAGDDGQYTATQAPAAAFSDGMDNAPAPAATGPDPALVNAYQDYLAKFQGGVQQTPAAPMPMMPVGPQPVDSMFGLPVFFEDGAQRG